MKEILMQKIAIIIVFCLLLMSFKTYAGDNDMKIKLTINDDEVIIVLQNNAATKQLVQMLPASFEFTDFAGEEKITNFPRPISLENLSGGMIATAGKLFIYAPWKNMGIFYKTHSLIPDWNLIELGEVESGLEILASQKNKFRAYIEVIK